MILINQSAKIITPDEQSGVFLLKACEYVGRNCYASQDRITDNSYFTFINNLIKRGHEAPLEFADITFDLTTSRAVLAELTRHRLVSFCVESQRYIQEAKTGDITFIKPEWYNVEDKATTVWQNQIQSVEDAYKELIALGCKPEQAREVLPNSTACRIIMKANLREWRHIFELRTSKFAYPQMRTLATQMLKLCNERVPIVFNDLIEGEQNDE